MADFFMGQVMMTGFGFAPKYFAACNGATLSISQNAALYSLLGIVYGGDGVNSFMLPDLRGRTPVGGGFSSQNNSWQPPALALGAIGGVETVSLTSDQNPPHSHGVMATSAMGADPYAGGNQVLAQASSPGLLYGAAQNLTPLGGGPSSTAGSGAQHENMQPFSVINFNIALNGIYPSRA